MTDDLTELLPGIAKTCYWPPISDNIKYSHQSCFARLSWYNISDLHLARNGADLPTTTCDQNSPHNTSFPFSEGGMFEEPVTVMCQLGHSQRIVSRVMGFWGEPFYQCGPLLSITIITLDLCPVLILEGVRSYFFRCGA